MDYDRDYFRGKTAAVTGAASGVGLALVEELLQSGAAGIVMADINPDHLEEQAKRLGEQYGGRVKGILCDVTIEESVRKMIAGAAEFFGSRDKKFDLLFNNAGAGLAGWFDDMTDADWKAAFDLNFYGALYGMRAVLPIMRGQAGGQIINIISGIAFAPMAGQTRYAATKAALNALSLTLRYEYWDENIRISSATPGTVATAIWDGWEIPPSAQTSQQAASSILHGVTNNDRIIFGDDTDASGAKNCFNHEDQEGLDRYYLRVARERRAGKAAL